MKKSMLKVSAACMMAVIAANSIFAGDGKWIKRDGVGTGGTNWAKWSDEDNWDQRVIATGAEAYADLTAASGQYVLLPTGDFVINRFWGAGDTVIRGDGKVVLGDLLGTFGKAYLYCDCTIQNSSPYRGPENLVFCGDITSISGVNILWWAPNFRFDLYANTSGEERIATPLPADKVLKWNAGKMTFTAPHGSSADIVARWSQTSGSVFLSRAVGQAEHILSVGTIVTGAGIPAGTFLKRVFPDGTIELSAAATETIAENEITFAAFEADVSIEIPMLTPYNGSSKRTLCLQKYRNEDNIVLTTYFCKSSGSEANQYLTVTTEEGMYPGKLVLTREGSYVTYLALDDADIELAGDISKAEISVPAASRHAILSVPDEKSFAAGCLTSVENALVKAGGGTLTIGVKKTALSYETSSVIVKEGTFVPSNFDDEEPLFIKSLTVKSGAAIDVPSVGLHVGTLVLEPGAIITGAGFLEYDTTDESVLPYVFMSCGSLRAYGASGAGAFDISVLEGDYYSAAEDGDTIFIFDSASARLKVDGAGKVDILCVGGGGGGGMFGGGGGGGGGVVYTQLVDVVNGYYSLTVGAGGDGSRDLRFAGENGGNSSVFGVLAYGGGGGGSKTIINSGASGGGAGAYEYLKDNVTLGAEGITGQGFAGGSSYTSKITHFYSYGGGGGGAGGPGGSAIPATTTDGRAGDGGEGVSCPIWSSGRVYGSGGGGGATRNPGKGGTGAGDGATYSGTTAHRGTDGVDGWGGGGGGGGRFSETGKGEGGNGGSGIVIIRFRPDRSQVVNERGIATGGKRRYVNGYAVHKFTENGTFTLNKSVYVDMLLVGGGGGGGMYAGGGGGGGGVVIVSNWLVKAGSYPVEIGAGGRTATSLNIGDEATAGGTTRFLVNDNDIYSPKAYGGGAGGSRDRNGGDGATGGGAGAPYYIPGKPAFHIGGAAIYGNQGFDGGASTNNYEWSTVQGGGGGGVGGRGQSAQSTSVPGDGGIGRMCDFTGSPIYYGGGGGGGSASNGSAPEYYLAKGGLGGGGRGGGQKANTEPYPGEDGTDGLGGGGGGGAAVGDKCKPGGNGGSGCVIIRYRVRPMGSLLVVE